MEFSRATVGILGLQTSLPLLVEMCQRGEVSRQRMVDLLSAGPARAFGMDTGGVAKGSTADVVVLDPTREWSFSEEVIRSKSKNSPFVGRKLLGAVEYVFVDGRCVVQDGALCG